MVDCKRASVFMLFLVLSGVNKCAQISCIDLDRLNIIFIFIETLH